MKSMGGGVALFVWVTLFDLVSLHLLVLHGIALLGCNGTLPVSWWTGGRGWQVKCAPVTVRNMQGSNSQLK